MKKTALPLLLSAILLLTACGTSAPAATSEQTSATTTPAPSTEATTVAETTIPQPTLPPNTSGKVEIRVISNSMTYPYNSYLITSSNGDTIVIDPTDMPKPEKLQIDPILITSTHNHPDHVDSVFMDSHDCEKILYEEADVTVGDFHVYTIPSSHSNNVINTPANNYIIVYEIDDLRIAHMGDIGQDTLTDDQLEKLGEIDIAFMQFENGYSNMDLINDKGFKLMEQLNPKIVIPTHHSQVGVKEMEKRYGEVITMNDLLTIAKEDLPEDTLNYYVIENTYLYKK